MKLGISAKTHDHNQRNPPPHHDHLIIMMSRDAVICSGMFFSQASCFHRTVSCCLGVWFCGQQISASACKCIIISLVRPRPASAEEARSRLRQLVHAHSRSLGFALQKEIMPLLGFGVHWPWCRVARQSCKQCAEPACQELMLGLVFGCYPKNWLPRFHRIPEAGVCTEC